MSAEKIAGPFDGRDDGARDDAVAALLDFVDERSPDDVRSLLDDEQGDDGAHADVVDEPDQDVATDGNGEHGGTFVLLACSSTKNDGLLPAGEKYDGELFKKTKAYAEKIDAPYAILSGKFGVLDSETTIPDYDMSVYDRDADDWGDQAVNGQGAPGPQGLTDLRLEQYDEVIVFTGKAYREPIEQYLDAIAAKGVDVRVPLEGASGIGVMLSRMNDLLDELDADDDQDVDDLERIEITLDAGPSVAVDRLPPVRVLEPYPNEKSSDDPKAHFFSDLASTVANTIGATLDDLEIGTTLGELVVDGKTWGFDPADDLEDEQGDDGVGETPVSTDTIPENVGDWKRTDLASGGFGAHADRELYSLVTVLLDDGRVVVDGPGPTDPDVLVDDADVAHDALLEYVRSTSPTEARESIDKADETPVSVDERVDTLESVGLSGREAEVTAWKEQGLTHAAIADEIGKSKSTVDEYSRRAGKKLEKARSLVEIAGDVYA